LLALPSEVPAQVAVAISTWQRAAEASDPVEAVIALWEVVEFYASGTEGETPFSSNELKTVRENATQGLNEGKKRRFEQVLNLLN
jgi:hypothetical protein